MDMRQFLRVLRRRWPVVVGCALVALLAAGAYVATATKKYQATVQLIVSTPSARPDLGQTYNGSQFSNDRVPSYAALAGTDAVTVPVIAALKLDTTAAHLSSEISASVPLNTALIHVTVTDHPAARSAAVANAVARQLATLVTGLEAPSRAASPVRVTIVQSAAVPTSPATPRTTLDLLLGLLVGLGVGTAVALFGAARATAPDGSDLPGRQLPVVPPAGNHRAPEAAAAEALQPLSRS